jgi:hypothetical protein
MTTYLIHTTTDGHTFFWKTIEADSPQEAVDEYLLHHHRRTGHRPVAWSVKDGRIPQTLRIEALEVGRTVVMDGGSYVARVPGDKPTAPREDKPMAGVERKHTPLDWDKPTPFDPFKGFVVEGGHTPQPVTSGREFGRFVLPDTKPTENLVDPQFALAAEKSRGA